MRTICITLPEKPERIEKARQHFSEVGVNAEMFIGINGQKFGILTDHPYMLDRKPGDEKFFVGNHCVGIFMSHYMVWNLLEHSSDSHFLILEDDAKFEPGWKEDFDRAMENVPGDFDVLYIGSCNAQGARKKQIRRNIYEVKYPMCFHAYVLAKKAARYMLLTNRDCYAPVDISPTIHSYDKLKVYTLLPRIVSQFNTEINP